VECEHRELKSLQKLSDAADGGDGVCEYKGAILGIVEKD
jgi:hypothetical protein